MVERAARASRAGDGRDRGGSGQKRWCMLNRRRVERLSGQAFAGRVAAQTEEGCHAVVADLARP